MSHSVWLAQELGAGLRAEPAGETEMVRMEMGGQQAGNRPLCKRAAQECAPTLPRALVGDPGVDEGPALVVFEQPDVDVIEREGQREAEAPTAPARSSSGSRSTSSSNRLEF